MTSSSDSSKSGSSGDGNSVNSHSPGSWESAGVWVDADDVEALAGAGRGGSSSIGASSTHDPLGQRSHGRLSHLRLDAGSGSAAEHGSLTRSASGPENGAGKSVAAAAPGGDAADRDDIAAAVTVDHLGIAAQAFWQRQQSRGAGRSTGRSARLSAY